ncbi:MAG TPA: VOC family protein, partial [Ktedonosporobacter sp.]|nr:VOC family protein [Ktedonosporobacter sp.]
TGAILTLGPHSTLELFDASQAIFVDQMEVGRRVSGPVRLALSVQDVEAATEMFQQAGALVLSQPKTMPWGDCNARVEPPDGMQITIYQTVSPTDQ